MNNNNPPYQRRCHCSWVDCELFCRQITTQVSNEHPWAQPFIRLQFPKRDVSTFSVKQYALFQSLNRHILSHDNQSPIPSNIYIYPHPFPIELLQWLKQQPTNISFSTPLTTKQAAEIEKLHFGPHRLLNKSNSLLYYHNMNLGKMSNGRNLLKETKYKNQFVKSPLTLLSELKLFISKKRITHKKTHTRRDNRGE